MRRRIIRESMNDGVLWHWLWDYFFGEIEIICDHLNVKFIHFAYD